jgi:hypothetical protein
MAVHGTGSEAFLVVGFGTANGRQWYCHHWAILLSIVGYGSVSTGIYCQSWAMVLPYCAMVLSMVSCGTAIAGYDTRNGG